MKPDIKRVKSLYGVQSFDAATAYAKRTLRMLAESSLREILSM